MIQPSYLLSMPLSFCIIAYTALTSIMEESKEDWLVKKACCGAKSDPYAAKAWLLTARTLFPKSFPVQVSQYCVETQVPWPFLNLCIMFGPILISDFVVV